jgi:hypothetical protein
MDSYHKASDRLRDMGAGLYGSEYTSFCQKVIDTHYRFYNELEPVLGNCPNTHAWFTNETETVKQELSPVDLVNNSSDDESFVSTNDEIDLERLKKKSIFDSDSDDLMFETDVHYNNTSVTSDNANSNGNNIDSSFSTKISTNSDCSSFKRTKNNNVASMNTLSMTTKEGNDNSIKSTGKVDIFPESTPSPKKKKKSEHKTSLISPVVSNHPPPVFAVATSQKSMTEQFYRNCRIQRIVTW